MTDSSRRNRVYRKRIREDDSDNEAQNEPSDSEQPSVSDILRQRKQAQKRKHGLAFSSSTQSEQVGEVGEGSEQMNAVPAAPNLLNSVYSKFTAQTGVRAGAQDKQLEAYIDARMKELYASQDENPPSKTEGATPSIGTNNFTPGATKQKDKEIERHFAPQEVDLGSSSRNPASQKEPQPPAKNPYIRIGRDGKPYIPRRFRNRRTDADIQRDNAVDAVLHENAPGAFDTAEWEQQEWGEGEEADERLAEAFRREYLNEVDEARKRELDSQREREKKKVKVDEVLRGPKLGGSRSARMKYIEEHMGKKKDG